MVSRAEARNVAKIMAEGGSTQLSRKAGCSGQPELTSRPAQAPAGLTSRSLLQKLLKTKWKTGYKFLKRRFLRARISPAGRVGQFLARNWSFLARPKVAP